MPLTLSVALALQAAAPLPACDADAAEALFAERATVQRVMHIEAALAAAQAEAGLIPHTAAQEITETARADLIPAKAYAAERRRVQHRLVALLNLWRGHLSEEAANALHYGATTVDIYDTALVLQLDEGLGQIEGCLDRSLLAMIELADSHRGTVMIGRTLGQHAQPITFGKKVTTWIGEFLRHRERIGELRARLDRSAILKGAVGDYSGLPGDAVAVERAFADSLGLGAPYAADWHGTRDVVAEYGLLLGLVAKSHARIGQEILLLQSTDIGEVREALPASAVGSSTMPHKRNPIAPEGLIMAGRTIPRLGEILSDDVVNLYERDNTSRQVPVIEQITTESVEMSARLSGMLSGLEVDAEAMRRNIGRTNDLVFSQRLVNTLADALGRHAAEELVRELAQRSLAAGTGFREMVLRSEGVRTRLSESELDRIFDPADMQPSADAQIDHVLAAARSTLAGRQ